MESGNRGSSSRRKSMPLKVKLSFGAGKASEQANGNGEDSNNKAASESESSENGDLPELPEGTVVVQPEPVEEKKIRFRGPEFKSSTSGGGKKGPAGGGGTAVLENVFCTACGRQVNPWKTGMVKKHKELKVLICRKCYNFLGSGEIAKDEDGSDEQCRWCGEGGRLTVCDQCPRAFCKGCIMRNFGRAAFTAVTESENWECYCCDPSPLGDLQKQCKTVLDAIGAEGKKPAKDTSSASKSSTSKSSSSATSQSEFADNPAALLSSLFTKLDFDGDSVVPMTVSLLKATTTFRRILLAILQAAGKPAETETEDLKGLSLFTFALDSSPSLKRQKCAEALGKSFQTFMSSLTQILTSASDAESNSTSQSKPSKHLVKTECNGRSTNADAVSTKQASKSVERITAASESSSSTSDPKSRAMQKERAKSSQDSGQEGQDKSAGDGNGKGSKGKGKVSKTDLTEEVKDSTKEDVTVEKEPTEEESMEVDSNEELPSEKSVSQGNSQSKSNSAAKPGSSGDDGVQKSVSLLKNTGPKVSDSKKSDKESASSQGQETDLFSPSRFTGTSSSQSQDDMSQQEENLFAKLELIQELAEEFCKESASADKSGDDCNVDSDSCDLPMVSFGPAETNTDRDDAGGDATSAKLESDSKGKGNDFSDISDADGEDDDENLSKPEKQTGKKDVKSGVKKVGDGGDSRNGDSRNAGDESGSDVQEDSDDVSSSDLIMSSDAEDGQPRRRQRKKNGVSQPSKKKVPAESGNSEQAPRRRKGSKRRMKTTPKKESHRRLAANHKPIDIESDSEESDSPKKTSSEKDGKAVKKSTKDDSDSESVDSEKASPAKSTKSKDVKEDSDEGAKRTKKEDSSKEGVSKKKQASAKKDLDSSEEVEKLEKEVEDLLSGALPKARKPKDATGENSKTSSKKDSAKKSEKTGKKGKKKKETDSSDSSESDEEDNAEEEEEDFEEDEEEMSGPTSKPKKKTTGNEEEKNSDLENELAKKAMMDELDEDDDLGKEDNNESSSESDIGALKKRKASRMAESKNKEEEKNGLDEEDSDFEPVRSRKRVRDELLDAKITESDSDVDVVKKKRTGKKRKHASDDESFEGDESEDVSDEGGDSVVDSDEVSDDGGDASDDSAVGKKKKKKGKDKKKKGKGKEKGKKRRRIKKMKDSSSEGEGEDDEEDPDKTSRKKIRKIKSDKKLADDTKAAAKAEEERRKRVADKQQRFNGVERKEVGEGQAPITTKLVLEANEETNDPIIQVNERLICKLKPHQVEAIQFMWDCLFESLERAKKHEGSGCILAHCMGLGKTLSVVSFVHTMMTHAKKTKMKTCLVVCPLNTVLNWLNEWEIWLDEDDQLTVYEMASIKQNWARADALDDWHTNGGIMIMGYEMLRNLSQGSRVRNKKQKAIFQKTLLDPGPDIIVCDEGHVMKNAASALSKAMAQIKTRRRIVLTGTPLQNNLIEYHCMVDFVKPKLLGTKKEFANRFVNPIINGQHSDSTQRDVKIMKARAHILHELLAGCVQRRDYSALTKFLPPKQEYVISVRLSPIQMELYEQYLKRTGQVDGQITTRGAQLFKDYQNLMKIWTHPWVLKMAEIRDELKMKYDDEDSFIDDDDYDEEKSFGSSDSSSEESLPKVSEGEDSAGEGTSSGRRSRRLRNRNRSDDKDEIVKEWKTRSRGGEYDDLPVEDPGPQAVSNEWWAQYLTEEDQNKMELGGKLVLLFDILRMCEEIGDKVLIFSQSLLSLDIIEHFLDQVDSKFQADTQDKPDDELKEEFGKRWTKGLDYFRLDGSTNAQLRSTWANIFNDPENHRARLFIISTRAGGLGINLVGANRVIIFDASWNPSHDVQSIFRVYRFGQTKPCYIYRFMAQGTMEEKIYDRQVTKLSLSQRVVDEHQIERHFTAADLQELYAFRPERLTDDKERPTLMLPKDVLLAEIMSGENKDWFVAIHEHDSLLENLVEQELTEEEKKAAWEDYENEKKGLRMNMPQMYGGPGLGSFLSQEYLLQTARNLREQHPDMPQEVLQAHLQRIIMMQIRQKQEEQRRLEMLQRQQEALMAQTMQRNAMLQAQYGMYSQMMPPGTRFSPSLYAHMAQPGISAYHSGMSTSGASGGSASASASSSSSSTSQKGAAAAKPAEVINLDESN